MFPSGRILSTLILLASFSASTDAGHSAVIAKRSCRESPLPALVAEGVPRDASRVFSGVPVSRLGRQDVLPKQSRPLLDDAALLTDGGKTQRRHARNAGEWIGANGVRYQENKGQVVEMEARPRPDILFTADVGGTRVYLRRDGVTTVFFKPQPGEELASPGDGERFTNLRQEHETPTVVDLHRMDMTLIGANPYPRVETFEACDGVVNYYLAHCPDGITGIREYGRVLYRDVYDRIDLEFFSNEGKLKYNFIVYPGGRASDIRMSYDGATDMAILENGALSISTSLGKVEEAAPKSYADDETVSSSFVLRDRTVSFFVGSYDADRTLVIDPWATYYGGSQSEPLGSGQIITDVNGNVFLSGNSFSVDLPTFNSHQSLNGGAMDAFIVMFNGDGIRLWATYYGGSDGEVNSDCAGDLVGNVILSGGTSSIDFPTMNPYQGFNAGLGDAFVVKFSSNGLRLWATYIGGSGTDFATSVAMDASNNVIITGYTNGGSFPTLNPCQSFSGGGTDAFIAKLSYNGSLLWSTYYGGNGVDQMYGVATDAAGNVLVTGCTICIDFPIMNPYQSFNAGGHDAVLIKIDGSGALIWATYFGGSSDDYALGVATDGAGNVMITGCTSSNNFPTLNPIQNSLSGISDAFAVKFSANGTPLWSTFCGGSSGDCANGITSDVNGNVIIAGLTASTDFPMLNPVQSSNAGNMDAFVMKYNSGGVPLWSTYYGGSDYDRAESVATEPGGDIVIGGMTWSTDFPTIHPFQASNAGSEDAFVVRFGCGSPSISLHPSDRSGCAGEGIDFASSASGSPMPDVQWQVSTDHGATWSDVPGATTTRLGFVLTAAMHGNRYRAVFTNSCASDTTDEALLSVITPPLITAQPANSTICAADQTVFTVGVTGTGATFQWQEDRGSGFIDLANAPPYAGVGTQILTLNPTTSWMAGYRYRCIVAGTCPPPDTSDIATLLMDLGPGITVQPASMRICAGGKAGFSLDATGAGLQYGWQEDRGSGFIAVTDIPPYSGAGTGSLNISAATSGMSGYRYRCIVMGNCPPPDTSDIAVLIVDSAPEIVSSPAAHTICAGSDAGFSVVASGTLPAYQWQEDRGTGFTNLADAAPYSGTATAKLAINGATAGMNGYRYRCIVSGACLPRDTSASATLTVHMKTPATISQPGPRNLCLGDTIVLRANTGAGFRYGWMKDGSIIPGARDSSYAVVQPGGYRVVLVDGNGCSDTSAMVLVTVIPAPSARVSGPSSQCPNGTAVYRIENSSDLAVIWTVVGGTPLSPLNADSVQVRWTSTGTVRTTVTSKITGCRKDTTINVTIGNNLVPVVTASKGPVLCEGDSVILSADAGYATYRWNTGDPTRSIVVRKSGSYTVFVEDANGCSGTSTPVPVIVRPAVLPVVTARGRTGFCPGDSVRLEAEAGFAVYAWSSGENTSSIMVRKAGSYKVTVTDSLGCAGTSQPVSVIVYPLPVAEIIGQRSACIGARASYRSQDSTDPSYKWTVAGGAVESGEGTPEVRVQWTSAGPGTLRLSVTSVNGCNRDTTIVVQVRTSLLPVITATGPTALCEGDSVMLEADEGYASFRWSTGVSTRSIVARTGGAYTVTVTDANGCSGTSSPVTVTVNPFPAAAIMGPSSVCVNRDAEFSVQAGAGNTYDWRTNCGIVLVGGGTERITLRWNAPCTDTVRVRVTTDVGCARDSLLPVSVGTSLQPTITTDKLPRLCLGDSVTLDAGGGYASYEWSRDGTKVSSLRSIRVKAGGIYMVNVSDSGGCTGSSTIVVTVHPLPTPGIIGPTAFCEGDTVVLGLPDGSEQYVVYEWRDENNRTVSAAKLVAVARAGIYTVTVTDSNGCTNTSPPHAVTMYPKPAAPSITRAGDTLTANQPLAVSYQWYFGSAIIPGATDQWLVVTQEGFYSVRITDANDCEAQSPLFEFLRPCVATATVRLPVIEAAPGERVTIPIILDKSACLAEVGARDFTATIRFNKSLLYPTGGTPLGATDDSNRVITIRNPQSEIRNPLTELTFLATLGNADRTPLHFQTFDFNGAPVNVTMIDGEFRLKICREGGDRLFNGTGRAQLLQNRPNPFNAMTQIDYEVIERGRTELFVLDILGRRVATLVDAIVEPGKYRVSFDATMLPSGMYCCLLQTTSRTFMRMMSIVK